MLFVDSSAYVFQMTEQRSRLLPSAALYFDRNSVGQHDAEQRRIQIDQRPAVAMAVNCRLETFGRIDIASASPIERNLGNRDEDIRRNGTADIPGLAHALRHGNGLGGSVEIAHVARAFGGYAPEFDGAFALP